MSDAVPSRLPSVRKTLGFLLRILLAGGIVAWLITANYQSFRTGLEHFRYTWLLPAAFLYFSHMLVCGWRWYMLSRVLKIRLSLSEAISLTMQAYFFSLVIPGGAIGGDFAKVAFLSARSAKGTKFEGALTILMDRIVGMAALFLLAIALIAGTIPLLLRVPLPGIAPDDASFRGLLIAGLLALCLAGLAATAVLFFHRALHKIWPIGLLMDKGDEWTHGMVSRMTDAVDAYRKEWPLLLLLTIISVFFIHIMTVLTVWALTAGLGEGGMNFPTLLTAVTIGNIAGLLPFSLSGIGIRDLTICAILEAGQVNHAAVIPVLYTGVILFFNLFGGLFFVLDPGRGGAEKVGADS